MKTKMDFAEAQKLHQADKLEEAKQAYLSLLKANPHDVETLHALGILHAQQEQFTDAIVCFQKAVILQPLEPIPYLNLGNALRSASQLDEAALAFEKALSINPRYAAAYNNLGTVYYTQGKLSEAIEKFKQAILKDPNYFEAYYNLGLAYSKHANFDEAIDTYKQLLEQAPTHPAANFQLGILFLEAGKLSDALQHFLVVEKFHPYHFETQSNLGNLYLKSGKLTLAKEHFLKALELKLDDTQVLFNLGVISMQEDNTDSAIRYYQRAIQFNPDFFAAHNNLGVAFLNKNHIPFALQHFKEALRIQPDNSAIEYTVRMLSQDQRLLTSPPGYITNLFDAYADHYEEHLLQSLDYQIPQSLLDALIKVRHLQKSTYQILDLGCGTGLCGQVFKPYASKLVGVDLSQKMLDVAIQKGIYDEIACTDIQTFLSQHPDSYDIILSGDVLVYIGDLKEIFLYAAQALKPKGLFVFNTEISQESDFSVNQSGRFSHKQSYLETLAHQNKLKVALYERVITRQQRNEPVYGHLFVLQK